MGSFLRALTRWIPECFDGEIVVGAGGDRDVSGCSMAKDGVVDGDVDVNVWYGRSILSWICDVDFRPDEKRGLRSV